MVGVIIMTNPQWIFFWTGGDRGFNMEDYPNFVPGVCFAVSHGMFSGFSYLCIRKMGAVIDPTAANFHFGFFILLSSIPCMLLFDNHYTEAFTYDTYTYMLMLGIVVAGFFSQWGVNKALAVGRVGPLASLNYF